MSNTSYLSLLILLGIIFLTNCKSTNYLADLAVERIDVSAENQLETSAEINALIAPYKLALDAKMEQVIGFTNVDLEKKKPASNLGNWMADAIHRKAEKHTGAEVDFAVQNYGGIRIPVIKKGEITKGKIYELMPFDNKITILYLEKEAVEELVNHMVKSGGWPISYSLKIVSLTETEPKISINNDSLTTKKVYRIAVPDYIANGGSGCHFLKDKKREDLPIFIRDALIEDVEDYGKANQPVPAIIEQRITISNE